MKTDELKQVIEQLIDPGLNQTLKETKGLKHFGYDDDKDLITLIISLSELDSDTEKFFKRQVAKIVKLDFGFKGLKIQLEETRVFNSIVNNKKVHFIGIISGKGGVGKSSVAANIAVRLNKKGYKTGIIDADIYGSSIPTVLGVPHQRPSYNSNKKIIPIEKNGIELISTEFFTEPSQPVIWRGAMLNSMISHFFFDTAWSEDTKFVIVDFPPGTGDVSLDIKNIIPKCQMILVTTPHPSASHVAVKAGTAAKTLGHEIIGVIENMSYYINPINQEKDYIFGQGGGEIVAQQIESELIAKLQITQPKNGTDIFDIDENNGKIYDEVADYIIMKNE